MKLADLLKNVPHQLFFPANPEITGISYDSRNVQPGHIFCALPGQHREGSDFIPQALSQGAAAILSSRKIQNPCPLIISRDPARTMALLSAVFYGEPSEHLRVIGVTGTNGKTTITYMIEKILQTTHKSCGVLGTINYRWAGRAWPAPRTTPLAPDLQALLRQMAEEGATYAVMEASSHALALKRVDGTNFRIGIFSNLTQDHLDFHKTMEEYFQAKARLFELMLERGDPKNKTSVINRDDPWGRRLLKLSPPNVLTYGLKAPAAVRATSIRLGMSGTDFKLHYKGESWPVRLSLLGRHNVYNALAALACAIPLNINPSTAIAGIQSLTGVPGRLEKVSNDKFTVLVDYAHTEDALRRALETVQTLKPKKIIVVFGCGGDRDRGKRPAMGETAARLADQIVLTSDNPRSENPDKIILDIEVGVRKLKTNGYDIVPDREEAIQRAIRSARSGDVVLIAGKGHETTQVYADRTIPFDDRTVARRVLGGQ